MYCPKCATQNGDDTKFCRSCGANLSLVPQALTGRLPDSRRRRDRHGNDGQPADLANGIQKVFTGLGFVLVSIAARFFAPAGSVWWFWLLIPAFISLGKGVAEIVSARTAMGLPPAANRAAAPPARVTGELQPRPTYDPLPPPSVTEGTTRHLDPQRDSYKERL
ncbi:MAG: zinc-ribbon domain-containing protein [Blastocatellia bacterium]